MTLPPNFSSFEHFQSVWKKIHNRKVRDYFSDLGGDNWDSSINGSRSSARTAATMTDDDTATMLLCRWLFFHGDIKNWEDFQTPIYGIPIEEEQRTRFFRPQITLYFCEKAEDVDPDYNPLRSQVSIRLQDEKYNTITQAKLENLAIKIKNTFAIPRYRWRRGKEAYYYKDREKLYDLRIVSRNETEAKKLVENVLDLQNDTPDWNYLRLNKAVQETTTYPTNPGTEVILGKTTKKRRYRPIGDVYFIGAFAHIYNKNKPIPLVDITGRFNDALTFV